MPLLGDIYEILMESPETRRMGNILNRLVNGSAKTFNQHTNVQLDNLYTVLDISELTGELLPVGMFVALDYVWDKAKEDRTKEKAIFIDEAWELIGDDDTNNPNNTKALQASGFRRFSRSFVATAVRPLLPPRILATLIEAGSAKAS